MSQQNDVLGGLDLSPLSSASQEQIMQAINGLAPLENIGFIYVGTARPDITNNPRMIRYIWLDITTPSNPVFKRYIASRTVLVDADLSWEALGVSNLSILTAMIATKSSTGGVDLTRMKLNSDYSATLGSVNYVMRVDATGKFFEVVSIDTVVADAGGLSLARLSTSGTGANKYLGVSAGALAYKYLDPANDITVAIGNRIPVTTAISPGTATYILRTNAVGTAAEWVAPNDATLAIALASLSTSGAVTNDSIRFNGSAWAVATPSLRLMAGDTINSGSLSANPVSTALHTFAHSLTTTPKLVRVVIVLATAGEAGYSVGDELDIHALRNTSNNQIVAQSADINNIYVNINQTVTTFEVPHRTTASYTAITEANWFPKVYAWK